MTKPYLLLVLGLALTFSQPVAVAAQQARNVLFIGVDDLRPELACYGKSYMQTPNLDRLAAEGIRFDAAYCQVAVCGASRLGLMSGLRPQHVNAWSHDERLDQRRPDVQSLPAYLKSKGWKTFSYGKIYHHADDDAEAWSEPAWRPTESYPPAARRTAGRGYFTAASHRALAATAKLEGKRKNRGPAVENGGDTPDQEYPDYRTASQAIATMRKYRDAPFFLAVGFAKPHLPFTAPAKYWNLYDRDAISVPPAGIPVGSPAYAQSSWGELKNYTDIDRQTDPLPAAQARELIHGYRACVSLIDAQVGRLLAELDALGLRDNTLVVFWSDHGFYLGDYGDWCKHSNYEVATRVPLLISGPGLQRQATSALPVELVDLYPTICRQLGLAAPGHCHGADLTPELRQPGSQARVGAFSQYRKHKPKIGPVLGTSLRTDRYRVTLWRAIKGGQLEDVELYDFKRDPGATRSFHEDPEYRAILDDLVAKAAKAKTGFPLQPKSPPDRSGASGFPIPQ